MADNKTKPTDLAVSEYFSRLESSSSKTDAEALLDLMTSATKATAVMWGPSIIGFGTHNYTYESGRGGSAPAVSFAVRKKALVVYGVRHILDADESLIEKLGPHTLGKGCLYLASLDGANVRVLTSIIASAYRERHGAP